MGTGGVVLRRIRSSWSDEPTGFRWVLEGRLAGSGYPASRSQVLWVKGKGFSDILTLTEKPLPREWVDGSGLEVKHVPMVDHEPPSQESLSESVGFLNEEIGSGRAVLVHCLAGQGRTMCVIGAYLMKSTGASTEDVLKRLRAIRPGAVELRQEESLRRFASSLSN